MELTIHDVGQGQCISLVHENGNIMLWDCGRGENFQPSRHFGGRNISTLFITNYDEDHISDLPNLRDSIGRVHGNWSITPEQLSRLKRQSGPLTAAMQSLLDMLGGLGDATGPDPQFPGVTPPVLEHERHQPGHDPELQRSGVPVPRRSRTQRLGWSPQAARLCGDAA